MTDANSKSNANNVSSHTWEVLLIYAIVFIISGVLLLIFPHSFEKYKYLSIGLILSIACLIHYLYIRNKIKKQKLLDNQLKSEEKLKVWQFLSHLPINEQNAIKQLFEIAKLRGLWTNSELDEEIKNYFLKSNKVKIKVTRGYNLFFDDGTNSERDIFNHCIFEAGVQQDREIELLLHYPCLKSEHTKNRAKANHIEPKEYTKTLFEVIKKIKGVTNSNANRNNISVKFYNDYEIKWRYYIFEDATNKKKMLFLNYYDDKKSGADSPMLKIEFGEGTLCQDFDTKFDEIFNDNKLSKIIVSNNKNDERLITDNFCGHKECSENIRKQYSEIFNKQLPEIVKPLLNIKNNNTNKPKK